MQLIATSSREVAQVLLFATSKLGLGRKAQAASSVLSVRTRHECPENNLRELRWDSNPNLGITRETKQKTKQNKQKKIFLGKLYPHTQKALLSEYQRRASRLPIGPSLPGGREAGEQHPAEGKGCCNLHRDHIFHQTVSRLPVVNLVFLGSCMVDICQECHSLRSAPQRRHTAHLGLCSHIASWKLSLWDWAGE